MTATAETETETLAIVTDATRRLVELQAVRDILLPDAADPAVAPELAMISSQIAVAAAVLRNRSSQLTE
jgi:hypothetical protein